MWSIDYVLIDQFATPTFIDVKRASDTRGRREVVAQMLDYVANASLYWKPGTLEGWFNSHDEDSDQRLLEFLDNAELSPENFWSRVDENLRSGRVRCVFVANSIPDSLIRLIEFLNEHLRLTEVYTVELPQHVSADQLPGVRVIVPKLIGNTTRAIASKNERPSAPKRQWDEESFFDYLGERSDPTCVALCREIREWTRAQGVRVTYGNGDVYGSMLLAAGSHPDAYVFASLSLPRGFAKAQLLMELSAQDSASLSLPRGFAKAQLPPNSGAAYKLLNGALAIAAFSTLQPTANGPSTIAVINDGSLIHLAPSYLSSVFQDMRGSVPIVSFGNEIVAVRGADGYGGLPQIGGSDLSPTVVQPGLITTYTSQDGGSTWSNRSGVVR
ncbi:MAG: hypothetical protein M0T78_04980 [Actinomycetota bacterium]|nr:hypothetical protein [Actinomycetota bacterium]